MTIGTTLPSMIEYLDYGILYKSEYRWESPLQMTTFIYIPMYMNTE